MIAKTSGIVLRSTRYGESDVIVNIYTKDYGLRAFMIKGGRKKTSSVKNTVFRPLQIMDIGAYFNNKNKDNMPIVRQVEKISDLNEIYYDIVRTSLAFFLTEVIVLSLREGAKDEELYCFLVETIDNLNKEEKERLKDFHIRFLYDFARILGFEPLNISTKTNSRQERNDILSLFVEFYYQHITNHKRICSQQVLSQVL